ncbi:MAG: transcription elongation factor GreA [Bacillota bacterium]|jgi:transcription elongation factor GreA|nr:transcription elongation factor GreA [Bacillota bacterium]MDK2927633.1 transcription elongation factor GreA [Bacillota bacterium]BCV23394.1 transcription elongation factor GreA [Gelria sp. Kuro-4]
MGENNMAEKEVILTRAGLEKLEQELEDLKTHRRHEVAERIKQAREFGDISENSEYEDAKREQAFIEGRILELQNMLQKVRVIDEAEGDGRVQVGSTVTIVDLDAPQPEEIEYTIVGSAEANPRQRKISNESPVGKALLGQSVGSEVEIQAPIGLLHYKIVAVQN